MPQNLKKSGAKTRKSELYRTDRTGEMATGDRRSATQARRSEQTRSALLQAAATIFARDGFEAARIEDIAAAAGRTRGAFYANFDSKSEVFLALRSMARMRVVQAVRERVEGLKGEAARRDAVMEFLLEERCDTKALLLEIEFKLFALRHPERLAELAGKHLDVSTTVGREEIEALFPEKNLTLTEEQQMTLSIEALLEGFALNAIFDPRVMTQAYLEATLPRLLGEILPRVGGVNKKAEPPLAKAQKIL